MFKHIVLATDGSPSAAKASQTAIDLARVHGAKITAAFVIDPYPYMSLGEDSGEAFQAYMNAAHATSLKVTGELESNREAIFWCLARMAARVLKGSFWAVWPARFCHCQKYLC